MADSIGNSQPMAKKNHWLLWLAVKGLVVTGVALGTWFVSTSADQRRNASLLQDYDTLKARFDNLSDSDRSLALQNDALRLQVAQYQKSLQDTSTQLSAQYTQCMQANSQFKAIFDGNSEATKQLTGLRKQQTDLDDGIVNGYRPGPFGGGPQATPAQIAEMRAESERLQQQILAQENKLQCEPR